MLDVQGLVYHFPVMSMEPTLSRLEKAAGDVCVGIRGKGIAYDVQDGFGGAAGSSTDLAEVHVRIFVGDLSNKTSDRVIERLKPGSFPIVATKVIILRHVLQNVDLARHDFWER